MRGLIVVFALGTGCAPHLLGLPDRETLVRYLARVAPDARGEQHFCALPYDTKRRERYAWVYWREGRRLVLWQASDDDALVRSPRMLALDGTLPPDVTRDWIEDTLRDCNAWGMRYTIRSAR